MRFNDLWDDGFFVFVVRIADYADDTDCADFGIFGVFIGKTVRIKLGFTGYQVMLGLMVEFAVQPNLQ